MSTCLLNEITTMLEIYKRSTQDKEMFNDKILTLDTRSREV